MIAAFLIAVIAVPVAPTGPTHASQGSWRIFAADPQAGPGRLNEPDGLALDSQGSVYVADRKNHRVQKFSPDGTPLAQWGVYGTSPGQFNEPDRVWVHPNGDVYVADGGRIQKLSPRGEPLAAWQLARRATGLVVDADENLIVASSQQVLTLSPDGDTLAAVDLPPPDRGLLSSTEGLVQDVEGNLYVADTGMGRIYKLSPGGEIVGTLSLQAALGLALDAAGNLYASARGSDAVVKFSPEGEILQRFSPGSPTTRSPLARGVAVDGTGRVFISYIDENLVRAFSADGREIAAWGISPDGGPRDRTAQSRPVDLAVDGAGNVVVAQGGQIHRFTRDGAPINHWGPDGTAESTYSSVTGVSVDMQGVLYVRARPTPDTPFRIETWASDGRLLGTVPIPEESPPPSSGIMVDGNGFIYMPFAAQLLKLSPTGTLVATWGTRGNDERRLLNQPVGMASDRTGHVYVATRRFGYVYRYSPDGNLLGLLGDGADAPMRSLGGVAVDQQGNVYVTDTSAHRVYMLSPNGEVVMQWGDRGNAVGSSNQPTRIAIDDRGSLYVLDSGNNRIQVLTR
jgi:sugar lactone lactonase YvrE